MKTDEIIIQIKSLPMHERRRIAEEMKPLTHASEAVVKLAWLFQMLPEEEKIAFIELIKQIPHGNEHC